MKSPEEVIGLRPKRLVFQLLWSVLVWLGVLWLGTWLTPPIPCNAFIEGIACTTRMSTGRHLVEIILALIMSILVAIWFIRLIRTPIMQEFKRVLLFIKITYGITLVFFMTYGLLAVQRLVQAG